MNVSNFFLRNFEEDDIFILSVIKFVHLYIKKKKKKKKKKNLTSTNQTEDLTIDLARETRSYLRTFPLSFSFVKAVM
jgi:hypothetical protein